MQNLLFEIGIIIIVATIGGYLAKLFRQPLIPAYILMGVLLGPVLGVIKDSQTMLLLSEIGIAFLLFLVGLELDIRKLKEVGTVATVGGALQAAVMFLLGYSAALLLDLPGMTALYLGLVMAFSSTMVVVKQLGDSRELDTLHGRIIIGILLLQDLLAILALSLLQAVGRGGLLPVLGNLGLGALLIVASYFLGKAVFPPLFRNAAKSLELLFLLAVSVCLFFALVFAQLGFSIAIGAFVAGIILGNLPYNVEIVSRVRPLKDFFTVLFFTSIGLLVSISSLKSTLLPLIIFFLLTLVVSPLLTVAVCAVFGYKRRTSFLTGLYLSQVSEFALILAAAGYAAGHIGPDIFSLVLVLTVTTIAGSSYLAKYAERLYALAGPLFAPLERLSSVSRELESAAPAAAHDVVLIGHDRTGYSIFRSLRRLKRDVLVVDFNPDVVRNLIDQGIPCLYGDIANSEVLEKLKLGQVKLVISTVPSFQTNKFLIKQVKSEHRGARVIVTSYQLDEALELYDAGADYVIIPHFLGGEHVSLLLEEFTGSLDRLIARKLDHINELRLRKELHPKHT